MNVVETSQVTYHYGRIAALRDVNLTIAEGALYALLGPNGSGKTTLLQVLMGLRRPSSGRATVLGVDTTALDTATRAHIGYVAEGQSLPRRMRLGDVERYLAPLYDSWDHTLATSLRERFELDPARKIGAMSRGEQMKAALLCALAPRPKLLVMDEPFTGMDALVKDELVRGLLESAGSDGWSVLLCSHDIGELELLADSVGFLDRGVLRLSESMERVRDRFKHVDVTLAAEQTSATLPVEWLNVERAGQRLNFLVRDATTAPVERAIAAALGPVVQMECRDATLREIFVALAKQRVAPASAEKAA